MKESNAPVVRIIDCAFPMEDEYREREHTRSAIQRDVLSTKRAQVGLDARATTGPMNQVQTRMSQRVEGKLYLRRYQNENPVRSFVNV